jgi:hypothetical protein
MGVTRRAGRPKRAGGAKKLSSLTVRSGPEARELADTGGAPASRTIRIPEETARQIAARIEGSGFTTVDAFVEYVLAKLLDQPSEVPFSEEDERRLRERLRSLGYID